MRPLIILGLATAALIAANCGARTPFDDVEPGGTGGAGGGNATTGPGSGPSATTSGTGVTTTTGGETTTGGATSGSSGVGGSGSTGTTTGTATSTGSTGSGPVTTGSTSTGTAGAGGRGGTGGFGGGTGRGGGAGRGGGRDAGPPANNPLLGILPGVRPTPACNQCVEVRCNGTSACSSDPACLNGVACYVAACASLPDQTEQLACGMKCFNGNVRLLSIAFQAVSCVYGSCGPFCG
jgi:hypothetical protein